MKWPYGVNGVKHTHISQSRYILYHLCPKHKPTVETLYTINFTAQVGQKYTQVNITGQAWKQ